MGELAKIFSKERIRDLSRLLPRIRYGVREELLPLVDLRGVGRVRARTLHARGLRSVEDLKRVEETHLAAIAAIGPALARNIKKQIAGDLEVTSPLPAEQAALSDFDS